MDQRIDVNQFYQGLDEFFAKSDTRHAMEYMESWLAEAEKLQDIYGQISVLNELGALCRAMGLTDRATAYYLRAKQYMKDLNLEGTGDYATMLINEGDVFVNTGEDEKALALFQEAKKILEECGLGGSYQMAALCNNISMIYRRTGRLEEAEHALDTAFRIIRGLDDCIGELGTTYVNLGELQVKQNKLRMAEESFREAIRIYEEQLNGADVHYSMACAGLAQVYYILKDYPQAETYYQKALTLIDRDFGRTQYYDLVQKNLDLVRKAAGEQK